MGFTVVKTKISQSLRKQSEGQALSSTILFKTMFISTLLPTIQYHNNFRSPRSTNLIDEVLGYKNNYGYNFLFLLLLSRLFFLMECVNFKDVLLVDIV